MLRRSIQAYWGIWAGTSDIGACKFEDFLDFRGYEIFGGREFQALYGDVGVFGNLEP